MATAEVFPYERQSDSRTGRSCGSACLSMVYRSLGKEVAQAEIWPAIAKENRFGSLASTTHLMAKDALSRGFAAIAFQARHPLLSLRRCREFGFRAILNHRLSPDVPTGHYSVLVDIDDKNVVLHDPFYGPSRNLTHAELLELWQPHFLNSEIMGSMLIAVAPPPPAATLCNLCRTTIPASVACPNCKEPVGLQPGLIMGCISATCVARAWNYICCPFCDYLWTFTSPVSSTAALTDDQARASSTAAPAAAFPNAPLAEEALNFTALFAQLDQFCGHILSLPAAANNPDIKRLIGSLAAHKEEMNQVRGEALKHIKTHQDQMAKLVQDAKQRREAHEKKSKELNRPSPPLDADALGRALLKNLGFID